MNWNSGDRTSLIDLSDRTAIIALMGVLVSLAVWTALSWFEALVHGVPFSSEMFGPQPSSAVPRLVAVVAVLFGTLLFQTLYARRLQAEDRYRLLIEESPDMVLVHRKGRVVFVNSQGAELLGCGSTGEAVGLPVASLWEPGDFGIAPADLTEAIQAGTLTSALPVRLRTVDGRLVDVELSAVALSYEGIKAVQCVVRDITARVDAERTIHRMAYYDPLTDLPNRALFKDRLSCALARARRTGEVMAVIFVDLDDFKAINDTLGHSIGDGVLVAVGDRLRCVVREEDTVARQSGDEFTVIARLAQRADVEILAHRIQSVLTRPFVVEGHSVCLSASIGAATYPQDGTDAADLVKYADAAMYRAKDSGCGSYRLYDAEMDESFTDRLELQGALRTAVEHGELELHYQPQVDMRDGHIVGVEALLRWNHPVLGQLTPGAFLEVADRAGLMGDIGRWVLDEACAAAGSWLVRGLSFGRIAVNLSAREFMQQGIVDSVECALAANGLPPDMLELEITETIAMYNTEQVLAILRLLREVGVRVAIDDFGTGYSSMGYLKRFPLQTLKIAQEFMSDVHVDVQSAAIVSMLVRLSRELGLDMVAEGVERQDQLDFLRECGCFVIQGYAYSRPLPAAEIEGLLAGGAIAATLGPPAVRMFPLAATPAGLAVEGDLAAQLVAPGTVAGRN